MPTKLIDDYYYYSRRLVNIFKKEILTFQVAKTALDSLEHYDHIRHFEYYEVLVIVTDPFSDVDQFHLALSLTFFKYRGINYFSLNR